MTRRSRLSLLLSGFLLASVSASADVLRLVIDGVISPASEEFIERGIAEAEASGLEAVLLELRTPGGLESSTRGIVNSIFDSSVPVIVWVAPPGSRAASAGFFILEAADVAAMAPGTNTGAAHPVMLGGEPLDDIMKQKIENDSAAFMRSIASRRNRNVAVAESAVLQSKSFTDQEALKLGLIDLVARNRTQLFEQISRMPVQRFDGMQQSLDLIDAQVIEREMTLRERFLSFIMDPNVAFVLLALGLLGIWTEINHPGAIIPGVLGALCILLAVFALNILPTSYAAVALIILAFILFALEAMFTSHGVMGLGGVIAMIFGGLLLVDGPIPELRVSLVTALAVSIPLGIIAMFLVSLAFRARKGRITTGGEGMIGEIGVAQTALQPQGTIFVHGEIWSAVASSPIDAGQQVVVRGVRDLLLEVDPVAEPVADPAVNDAHA